MPDLNVKFDVEALTDITPESITGLIATFEKMLDAGDSIAKATFWTDADDKAVAQARIYVAFAKAFVAQPWVPGAIAFLLDLVKKFKPAPAPTA